MSVGKENHYNINRMFLSIIGAWPQQSFFQKFFFSSNVILACGSQMLLQTWGMIGSWPDWDIIIECASNLLINALCLLKFANCLFNTRKMRDLVERMQDAWNLILTDIQIEILKTYTYEGYKMTKWYAVLMYTVTIAYTVLPHVPTLLAYMSNTNETIERVLLFHVESVVDVEKYYYLILFHSYYASFLLMTLLVAADGMFLVYVQHACGMFTLTGHQIENVRDSNNLDINIYLGTSEDEAYKKIADSIIKHKDTLEFAELMASAYSTSYFLQCGINVVLITFTGVQAVIYMNKAEQAVRFGMCSLTVSAHFLFLSVPSQKLIDHSLQINDSIYYSNWYAVSIRSRRLLDIMLMRSRIPSQITAGKMYTMSLETFTSVMQAAMSYFTVLMSVR